MIDLKGTQHHAGLEEIVDLLCKITDNPDRKFFRGLVIYYIAKAASNMRATIVTKDRGEIPVNMFLVALATSGFGKGYAMGILEKDLMEGFKTRYINETLPKQLEEGLWKIATERSVRNQTDLQAEYDAAAAEAKRLGYFVFDFDDGSPEGVKELRNKLLIAESGALSFQVDEIGSNMERSWAMTQLFLELYDQGWVKSKLTKNSKDNIRLEDLRGKSPSNLLYIGTQAKLLDGGKAEELFYTAMEAGLARRSMYAFGSNEDKNALKRSAADIYNAKISPQNQATMDRWKQIFDSLADPARHGWRMTVDAAVGIELIEYQLVCQTASDKLKEADTIRKAELSHRYFRALKVAGVLAFMDGSNEIEMAHLYQAIMIVEESGQAFERILKREKPYVRLANFLAESGKDITHADLTEALPFYGKTIPTRNDMMTMAISHGYKHNIIIKKTTTSGIDFFEGSTLPKTDLSKMVVSYSDHWAANYEPERVPFTDLHQLTQAADMNWCNHHFRYNHRCDENVIAGFNMLVLDVDAGVPLHMCHNLLKEIQFLTYTTKRHTDEKNRYRLVIPMNYELELDKEDYKEFAKDVIAWLPFQSVDPDAEVDHASYQRSKKWMSHPGEGFHYNLDAELFNALPFIPKTKMNEDHRLGFQKLQSMDHLERWFVQRMSEGDRNNQMIKYALALVDGGMDLISVSRQVHDTNTKITTPLKATEIDNTIMVTVARKLKKAA